MATLIENNGTPAENNELGIAETQPIGNNELGNAEMQSIENNEKAMTEMQPTEDNEMAVAEMQPTESNEMAVTEMQPTENNEMSITETQPTEHNEMAMAEMQHTEDNEMAVTEMQPTENNEMAMAETYPIANHQMIMAETQPAENNELTVAEMLLTESHERAMEETYPIENHQMVVAETQPAENNELVVAEMLPTESHEMAMEETYPIENHQMVVAETQPAENNDLTVAEMLPTENNELAIAEMLPDESNELAMAETLPNKRRKKKSIVWEHFTIENVGGGCRRACCKQCKQSFAYSTGSKVAGTSHLKRHIAKGTCPVVFRNQERSPSTPYSAPMKMSEIWNGTETKKRRYRTAGSPYFGFDPDRCRHEIARMIIMHDYPLHMVEHPGFVAFVKNLQPRFDMVSFNTVQGDCVATYLREKQGLQKLIEGIPGRICLTLDLWTSSQTVGYVYLTGYFIDIDWKLHRKILNVVMEPYPESDSAFGHAVDSCLADWSMEGRLFSLTINQSPSEAGIENLRALLSIKNPLMLNGQLLVGNCLARTLSSIALEALRTAQETVRMIRDSVKYVKTSESHEDKFLKLKQQLKVPSMKLLTLDDQTRWNTTYEMLVAASELREVFSCFDTSDPDYKEPLSMEVWKQVETLCTHLKLLFDTATILAAPTIQTTNTFFHEAWKIQLELGRAIQSEDPFVSNLTRPMHEKFDKYWKNCCLVLAIAVVMDPRFKMKLVEFSFSKIYGDVAATYVKIVDEGIHELFLEYVALPLPLTPPYLEETNGGGNTKVEDAHGGSGLSSDELGLTDFDMYIMETTSQQSRSELDQYLEESLLPRVHEFDVLGWWKLNKTKYPTLSKMARDILTIPVCTLGPDSVFRYREKRDGQL
ncbi:BED zinc finger and hAT dimerization domain-containing protein DAYSLEEPER [Actinidia rufa]|uniref:BED zinc finger and hAT dimerization domain-containing protein DAYSLEEPER n=1 Tax=Actinidia rufa TaxID=165716 RepID=A0A7J0HCV5_9ERIC|nr:BED zinc finger and hAT dimerization domain-containing protein DAYSLEEPER [Actinidia rufa]